ncbi:hypothetical protein BdWA1_002729 [Babesia duncani]|uniref:Uncharacterized protein n=1 Tax=Babesia duncani TaxID=323732 RepID=A0AAD9PK10_9APIC|nr:hypothetical protein BdWA1_002729 [Babesia duncani]
MDQYNENTEDVDNEKLLNDPFINSCAILFDSIEGHGIVIALKLIGKLLSNTDEYRDKYALLICKRKAWNEAIALMGNQLFDTFASIDFIPQECTCKRDSVREKLNALVGHCFGSCNYFPVDSNVVRQVKVEFSKDSNNGSTCEEENATSGEPHIFINECNVNVNPDSKDAENTYNSTQTRIDENVLTHDNQNPPDAEALKRLLVRFVDQVPTRQLVNSVNQIFTEPFNTFLSDNEMLWNFIQAANELSNHGTDISLVVVAGLAQMQMDSYEAIRNFISTDYFQHFKSSKDLEEDDFKHVLLTHPFSASTIIKKENCQQRRIYRQKYLTNYAFSVALLLNSAENKIANTEMEPAFPLVFLVESMPKDPVDRAKFISFLSTRFDHVLRID